MHRCRAVNSVISKVAKPSNFTCSKKESIGRLVQNLHARNQNAFSSNNALRTYTTRASSQQWFQIVSQSNFSTAATEDKKEDEIEKNDSILDKAEVVRRIKQDLAEADINEDGRLDSDELKIILKKYSDIFSDEDVVKIGELFYVGKAGGDVSHEDFIKAIAHVTSHTAEDGDVDESGLSHRRLTDTPHPLGLGKCGVEFMYGKNRGLYSQEELDVKVTHLEPKTTSDKLAHAAVGVVRVLFDAVSGWNHTELTGMTKSKIFRRVIFLETVAAIPGFVAAMVRHFKSLRTFNRDGGMLNMFLDEANNERMHLLTFVRMRDPHPLMKYLVMGSQTVVGIGFFILYNISPDFCHRFVGYVEEEAVHTYTDIITAIETAPDSHELASWRTEAAPAIAKGYWHLGQDGTVLDVMYAIRADEAEHRDVNHVVCGIKAGQVNPLYNPEEQFDKVLVKYVENMMETDKTKGIVK